MGWDEKDDNSGIPDIPPLPKSIYLGIRHLHQIGAWSVTMHKYDYLRWHIMRPAHPGNLTMYIFYIK